MVLKDLTFNSFSLGGCGGLERTNFILEFLVWKDVMDLKDLTFNSFSFGRVWRS